MGSWMKVDMRTVEDAIPEPLREAVFAAINLFHIKYGQHALVRLRWRSGRLRRIEICAPPHPVVGSDDLDVLMTLVNAGFSTSASATDQIFQVRGVAAWVWEPI